MMLMLTLFDAESHFAGIVNRPQRCLRAVELTAFILVLLTVVSGACSGQERLARSVEERVERVLRANAQATGAAGIAFGMVQDGSAVLECYTGYASWSDKTRIDKSSVFNWASLSKGLTAVCALKMVEQGNLNLDADINTYIPELKLNAPVTLRQILCMQGGIGGYDAYPELLELEKLKPQSLSQQTILEKMSGKQISFTPGTRLGYSSPGYILLSIAMEKASKKSFAEIVDEIVAKPLNLTSLRVGGDSAASVVSYRLVDGKRQPISDCNNDWRLGAGAIKSNLPDALAFASSLLQSSILTPASTKELFKRRASLKSEGKESIVDKEGNEFETLSITYGFMRYGDAPDAPIAVDGMQPGARSVLIIYPRQHMASVIFANTSPLDLKNILIETMNALSDKK